MRKKYRQSGISLIEIVVVISIITILGSLTLPAIRALRKSFETGSGTSTIISSALASARTIAVKERRYAGIRFQTDLSGSQYIIFIIHDKDNTDLIHGFRAVEGCKPVKLPDDVSVADLIVRVNFGADEADARSTESYVVDKDNLNDPNSITDMSSFSVVFSPAGKLVTQEVRMRNTDGIFRPSINESDDDIFNSDNNVINDIGMFIQDDYANLGLGAEYSRTEFVIYGKSEFDKLDADERLAYLNSLEKIYINPYTGTLIDNKR